MNIDEYILLAISPYKNIILDYLSFILNFAFSTTFLLFFFVLIYLLKKEKEFFLSLISFITNGVVVWVIKEIVRRPRPMRSGTVLFQLSDWSFPSGHAASAFLIAVLASKFWPKYGKYFYILAILVAFSRVYLGIHYLSDVVCGSLIGFTIGIIFIKKKEFFWRIEKKLYTFVESLCKK